MKHSKQADSKAGRKLIEMRLKKMQTQKSLSVVKSMLNISDEMVRISESLGEHEQFADLLPDLALINYALCSWQEKTLQRIKDEENNETL